MCVGSGVCLLDDTFQFIWSINRTCLNKVGIGGGLQFTCAVAGILIAFFFSFLKTKCCLFVVRPIFYQRRTTLSVITVRTLRCSYRLIEE